MDLEKLNKEIFACTACAFHSSTLRKVPGHGNETAKVFVIAEAPGRAETLAGIPLCGAQEVLKSQCFTCVSMDACWSKKTNDTPEKCLYYVEARGSVLEERKEKLRTCFGVNSLPENDTYFTGKSGDLIDRMLYKMKVDRDDMFFSNVCLCRPKDNKTPTIGEGRLCGERFLKRRIEIVKPRVIIALGNVALTFLVNDGHKITAARGQVLETCFEPKTKVVPTWHPSYLIRNGFNADLRYQFMEDWKLALDVAGVEHEE